ncbi:amino acid adenylation domain-containing protein [Brevibacillus thermoruber]|uniref:amino acid adenylation domain-containing protein n=1 Tax=Brevibacillus thermoruber TaxID=33942 RepID=UPI0003FD0D2B|nr:non-ribosomal peptide synthetase [Brevibacillus thermoruber]
MNERSSRISTLSDEQRKLLALRLHGKRTGQSISTAIIPRRAGQNVYLPLSYAQQRLWFLNELEPESSWYNTFAALRLTGPIQSEAMEKSFNAIVERHEILRSSYRIVDGQPVQKIEPRVYVHLPVIDLQMLPVEKRLQEAIRLSEEDVKKPFDLSKGPLIRVSLIRLNPEDHLLLLNMHHIVSDGWSVGVLVREMTALYESFCTGRPSPLPELPIQYPDFAIWQREQFQGTELEKQIAYWKERLSGELPVLEIPTDRPRPKMQTFNGARYWMPLDERLMENLKRLSRKENVTLFMTFLAAYKLLLSRYTGLEDILVGSPVANRPRVETEGLIGVFVNTLVLRTDLTGNPTFREFLQRVRLTALGAYEHQDLPFEKLVEVLQPNRNLSHSPFFQTMFILNEPHAQTKSNNLTDLTVEKLGLRITPIEIDNKTAKFDLTINVDQRPDGWLCMVEYNTDLFDQQTIQRLVHQYRYLLEQIVHEPDKKLSEYSLLTKEEAVQLEAWRNTETDDDLSVCLPELFAAHVEKAPHELKVVGRDGSLTMRELDKRANQVAHYLKQHGVGPGVLVGLCINRSLDMVVGLLGILKAGGAFVPIDPSYPIDRIAYMVEQSGMPIVLTEQLLIQGLSALQVKLICVDAEAETIASFSSDAPTFQATKDDPVYVIYTSGSTGKPKGVQIKHESLTNVLLSMKRLHSPSKEDRLLAVTTISFDISIIEIFLPLITDMLLVIATKEEASDGQALIDLLNRHQITILQATPSTFRMLLEAGWSNKNLRKVVIGGEALPRDLATSLLRQGVEVWNQYGPTETTIWVTCDRVENSDRITIGRPIQNTETYVLDAHFNQVPIGVPGELYIGGKGLALGYLNRMDLTLEKFLPHPFSKEEGARLYRTGDLVRYLSDGKIEYLGRIDQQVKVRGFRIELGEIEAVLETHPYVKQAVAVVHDGHPGDKRLVAYVTTNNNAPVIHDLYVHLRKTLPEYMIPSTIMILDAIPLTPNGKVDRKVLPAPEFNRRNLDVEFVAPRNELEEQVAMVWKEVLHQDEIGIQDNFFELGGHSILITQVIARLKNLYEVEIPLRHFFANPTIEGIAEFICSQIERKGHVDASEVKIGSTLKTVLASVSQKRLRFLEQFTPNSQQSILTFGIRLSGNLEIEAFERSIHELVRRHESLRTRLVEQDGELLQEILDEVVLPFTMYDLRNEPTQEEVANMLLQQLQRELEPAKGVMLKTMLLRTKDQEHLAMFAVHRLAADEGSLAVMLDELATLYSLASKGMNFSLPSPSAQFSDFVLEQVERMPEIDQQFAYWENQLSGVHSVLSLPTDRPRPPIQTTNGGEVVFEIPSDVYEALKILSERQGVERYTVLFAAYVTLLHRYTGQEDILIGMKADSREEKWNHVIGPIENTLVLRANLTTGLTVSNLLHKCQILVDEARKNREVPFETILERLHLERDTSRHPLFQATFELRSESPKLEAEGVRMELVEPVRRFTHYDLTLVLKEQKDGCSGKFVYNADLFDASMISRMAGHFLTILDSIIENPLQKMSKLKMLSEEELQIILAEWKQEAQTDVLQEVCVHHLIEKQAQMTPHAVAVKYRDKELTYEELNERSSRLANYLRKLGVGANSLVGISVERSLEMVIGLLGILKAGGAYLPLDPAYPSDRLAFMLQDSKVGVLLTQERLQGKLPTFNGKIVCLDADWGDIVQEPELPCNSKVGPDDLMYVMYTSGSTGTPKGVMISHRGVVNHNLAVVRHFDLNGNDRVLQFASISFDIAVEEIFPTLIVGGTLVLWKDLHVAGGEEFLHWIDKEKITVLNLPTAYWHGWVHDLALLGSSLPPSVRLVVVGGEKASAETYVDWLKLAAHRVRWVNTYGPTEATVTATLYEPDKEYKDGNPIPIGRPLDNVQIYVLDTQMNPVPIGVPGELYIGGPGVARGYLNRPDLTDERFVGNPFASQTGERLFKTGDIVRYLPDGNLEFVCRMDNQVKIRGYRIELGEIEAVLEQNSQVSQAVVIVREDAPGIKQLTAYVVASPSTTDVIDLRDFAKSRLPEYMVPTSFVLLDQLPMTPNGKIDYKRLPEAKSMPVDEEAIVAPRNLIEEMVAQIWKDVLRKECVSMFDNFFHLGGHSLLAAQVMTRLRSQFKVEISMARFFNNPTVADLATEVDRALKEQKQNGDLPIIRVSRHGKLPLSFSQRRLWFLCQLEPERMHYNIPMAVRLRGNLNLDAFHRSLNEIVRRHESLRTVFRVEDGEPYQVVLEKLELPLPVIDLRHMEPEERSEEAMRLINVWAQELFNLEQGPLLKVNMIRLDDEEFVVMFNIHHIVSDGWSTSLIIREMSILYEAYCQGRPSPLEELSIQYADYAFWQRTRIQGEYLESQMNYWRKVLGGDLPVLQLPTDRPRPPVMSHRGKLISFKISKELNDKLKAFSRENGVTLFMTLLSAYQLLLYRYSGQEDICVGTPIAVRNRPEMEGLIGFFVNTLVIRTDLSGEPTFLDLLDRVREVVLGALDHQEVPFESLGEELQPIRDMSRTLIFQAMFVLHNLPLIQGARLPGLSMELVEFETNWAKFDLTLSLIEQQGGLEGKLEYNSDVFDASTMERFISHFETLLGSIVENPNQNIARLNLLPERERKLLLEEWKQEGQVNLSANECVHQLIEKQAQMSPHAVAVKFQDSELTYGELNERADRLAHQLRRLGVKANTLVGISVERSPEMVVGILGILKAGGAYLPLDPSYSSERLAFMIQDSKIEILLTQKRLKNKLPTYEGTVVFLDDHLGDIAEVPTTPYSEVGLDDLMYVMYTSGSTGTPKGVMISHRGVMNHNMAVIRRFTLNANDRVLQFASFSFDIAVEEIFPTLIVGGTLVLWKDQFVASGEDFLTWVHEERITVLNLPTAYWHGWVQDLAHIGATLPPSLRLVVVGGEKASTEVYATWSKLAGNQVRWVNTYGPTEATVTATWYENDPNMKGRPIPIGRPIDNVEVYVLDAHMQPVAVGVPGELYIGGPGVAKGYLYRKDLTEERFVPNPFGSRPGERLYKTGDIVRYLSDGNLEYIGRIDSQVKIRGYRIELGEIEVVLEQHPYITQAVVMVREDEPGVKRLTAYIVADSSAVNTADLRLFLKARLPEYMIPADFVLLEELPLTPNGKVDHKVLPKPEGLTFDTETFVAPRNLFEEMVAQIWSDVLKVKQVGAFDDFFHLGGHSLLATQVISRANETFRISIPLRTIFEYPKLSDWAAQIQKLQSIEQLPPIEKADRNQPLRLSFAQQRLWVLDQLLYNTPLYTMSFAVRVQGSLDVEALEKCLNEIVRRQEVLRTIFAKYEGEAIQQIQEPRYMPLPLFNLTTQDKNTAEEELMRLIQEELERPFDLTKGPLIRFSLVALGEQEHVLLLTMHHIVSDGWSLGILMKELTELYKAYTCGTEPNLPELQIQYADYALHQRNWLQGEVLERQLAYWKKQLSGSPPVLQLPTDKPRPPVQSYRGACEVFKIPNKLTTELKALGHRHGATLFMTLLAAFQALLCRYTGQEDIPVGTPVAGRSRQETEGLIGFFVNTLVLRTDLSGNPTFVELMRRVREVALGAYMHQDVPFELLVEQMVTERSMSHSPLFQVMFALQNTPTTKWEIPNLELSPVGFKTKTSKFDLTLDISETDEGLLCWFEYSTDLFEAETIRRMARHFHNFLEEVVKEPEQPIREVNILDQEERDQLLHEWNRTEMPYGVDETMITQFERQAACQPDAVAVIFEDQSLTYRELNAKANQLARYLQAKGVGRETLVGIKVERSLDMIVGLLGILKAGGAYLPLDPNYPSERVAYILEDAQAPFLLTQAHLLDRLPKSQSEAICLDTDWDAIGKHSIENLPTTAGPEDLAYVIYTSGSTGHPKGVAIRHRNAVALIAWSLSEFSREQLKGVLASTSLCFDLSVFEIFVTLSAGGSVILAENALHLPYLPARNLVTLVNTVPSAIQELLAMNGIPESVRTVNLAGEPLRRHLVDQLYELGHVDKVYNLYGPSEDTTYSTYALVPRDSDRSPTIGRPIANTQLYVLDGYMQPVPIGVTGELYIGGDGLARKYLNRPELTAEKFVPNPFTNGQDRLYRTGDLVRYLPNAELEYLGRLDHQVKIRGFRIELGEIETCLVTVPSVREAVVHVREDVPGDKRLVAYVVPAAENVTPESLTEALHRKLPNYMVPSIFVLLESLPLTPNGKVDRKALPAPERLEAGGAYVAPRDVLEHQLVQIWEDLFGLSPIGIRDNFFNLGGHSLQAVRMISQIEKKMGQSLPLAVLFQAETIEQLAVALRNKTSQKRPAQLVEIQKGTKVPLFLMHPIGGNVFCYGDLAREMGCDQPVYALQAAGLQGETEPLTTIEEMAKRYLDEIRMVQKQEPYRLGGWSMGGLIAYEMAFQLVQQGESVMQLILFDTKLPDPAHRSLTEEELEAWFIQDLAAIAGRDLPASLSKMREEINRLDAAQRRQTWLVQLRKAGLLPPDLTAEGVGHLLRVFKANAYAMATYNPKPLDGLQPILVSTTAVDDNLQHWRRLATGLKVYHAMADHYSLMKKPLIGYILELLQMK